MTFQDNGNVGIGTQSPGRQLTLYGEAVIRLDGNSADPGLDFNTSGTSDMQIRYRGSSDKLQVYSYGTSTNVMTIQKSDGFVGIGTESPSSKLHVSGGDSRHSGGKLIYEAGGISDYFKIQRSSSSGRSQIQLANESGAELWRFGLTGGGSEDFAFWDGSFNHLVLDRANNKMKVAGGYLEIGGGSTIPGILGFNRNISTGAIHNASYGAYQMQNEGGTFRIQVYNSSGGSVDANAFVIKDTANVGIGTASPGALLDIGERIYLKNDGTIHWGSAAAHGVLSWDTGRAIVSSLGTNNLDLKAPSGKQVVVNESGSNVDFRVEGDTHTHLLFIDASNDNVGIHNSSPWTSTYLDVGGADTSANMRIGNGIYFYDSNRFISRNGNHIDFTSTNGTMQMRDGVSVFNKYASGSGDQRNTYNHFAHKVAANQAGAFICNTDIPRASNRMTILHFEGYAYGDASVIDFKVCFYPYSGINGQDGVAGRPYAYSIVDNGNDGRQKFIGVNSSGNIAVAIGDYNDPNKYYWHYHVNILQGHSDADLGSWTGTASTTDGFGWLDKRTVYAPFFVKEEGSNHQDHHRVIIGAGNEGNTFRTDAGYLKIGPQNASFNHFETDRPTNYFNKSITTDGGVVSSYNQDLSLRRANSSADRIDITDSYTRVIVNNTERFRATTGGATVTGTIDVSSNVLFGSGNIWQLDQGSWTGGSSNQANIMLSGAAGTFGFHSNTSTVDILTDGNVRALADVVAYYSDTRLKHKFQPITSALEKVQSLEGFTYESNELAKKLGYNEHYDNLTGKRKVGVSAQQVQEVLPEAVTLAPFDTHKNEDGTIESKSGENYLTVKYDKIVPLLIEAIKEQQQQINKLEEKLNG